METKVTLNNGWVVDEKNGILTITDVAGKQKLVIGAADRNDILEAIQVCGQQAQQSERRGRVAKEPKKPVKKTS